MTCVADACNAYNNVWQIRFLLYRFIWNPFLKRFNLPVCLLDVHAYIFVFILLVPNIVGYFDDIGYSDVF